jgi:hypothetical protein
VGTQLGQFRGLSYPGAVEGTVPFPRTIEYLRYLSERRYEVRLAGPFNAAIGYRAKVHSALSHGYPQAPHSLDFGLR